jgi:C-terminal processing protease CtpA/Prc
LDQRGTDRQNSDQTTNDQNQQPQSAFLGVRLRDLTEAMKKEFKEGTGGALVAEVIDGSPADQAGLRPGDIITAIDGVDIKNWRDARQAIQESGGPGTQLRFTISRDQETKELTAKLANSRLDLIVIFAVPARDQSQDRRNTYLKPETRQPQTSPPTHYPQPERD